MKILKFDLSRLRNEEHYQFQTDFNGLVNNYTPEKLDIKPQFDIYQSQFKNEEEAIEVIRKSAITDDLTVADSLRDATFRGLTDAVKAATKHFIPEVRKAALSLQTVLDHYGNIARKSFDEETASITNLVADLQSTYATDANTASIADWVVELQKNNINFNTIKTKRYDEESSKTQLRMKEVRTAIDATYHTIAERINALIIVSVEPQFINFANELNHRIENYNHLIAQRKGHTDKDNFGINIM